MKILYLVDQYKPEYYTGTIKVAENIAGYFTKKNQVTILSYSDVCYYASENKWSEKISYWHEEIDDIQCIKFNIKEDSSISYGLYNEEVYKFAMGILKEINPDIIHVIHPRRIGGFIKAAIDLKKKYIITCTDTFLMCANLFLFTKSCDICDKRHIEGICSKECNFDNNIIVQNKIMSKEYVKNAAALVVDSNFQIKIFSEYFDKEVIVINHGNHGNPNSIANKEYPKEKLIFSFNGNSSALKGIMVAIGAFNILEKFKDVNVELHVHGNCDDTVKLLAGSNVKFFGRYENNQVSQILSTVDFLICPSICYENYPFVITEAFMNKTPVLASNEGGMKTIVKNFVNGFTFERANPAHLAEIIKNIYFNQGIIQNLVNNLENFKAKTVEEEMMEYEKLYEKSTNNKQLSSSKKSDIEIMWEKILANKYKFEDLDINKYRNSIKECSLKNNYYVNVDAQFRFILRLKNMEQQLNISKNKNVIIWGSGMSAKLTIRIIKKLYNNINIKLVVDKFKDCGELEGIPIKNIIALENEKFDYLIICTSPGKKEAEQFMDKLNKKVNIDYNFGICVE